MLLLMLLLPQLLCVPAETERERERERVTGLSFVTDECVHRYQTADDVGVNQRTTINHQLSTSRRVLVRRQTA